MQIAASECPSGVLCIRDVAASELLSLAARYDLAIAWVADAQAIPGSFWGEPEAGVIGSTLYVRDDTPLHSALHEFSHLVCMSAARRASLQRDAGGDDAEECAVCYLQIILADEIRGAGRTQLMQDMDAWGYSFRLGSARRWFEEDADDARQWLLDWRLLNSRGRPSWQLRP
jgi:hypothetical protein